MNDASPSTFRIAVIPVTGFQQNCSLVFDDVNKRGAVVDPGGDVDVILAAVKQAGITVENILLTHGHIDHAGGADELRAALRVPVIGPHVDDKFLLDSLPQSGLRFGITNARAVAPDQWLKDGDKISVAGFDFEIIHAPGHSPGSVVFFNRAAYFALMGDVLFQGSIGRTDLPGGDHETLLNSIRDKIMPLGDDVMFLPGHGAASHIGHERLTNPFLTGKS